MDAFVQSCDKNLLVPVGGAVVATFTNKEFLNKVASTYAGRASAAPAIDLLITLLQMGKKGVKKLLADRKVREAMILFLNTRILNFTVIYQQR